MDAAQDCLSPNHQRILGLSALLGREDWVARVLADWTLVGEEEGRSRSHPNRTLIPLEYQGLLVVGRSWSASHAS